MSRLIEGEDTIVSTDVVSHEVRGAFAHRLTQTLDRCGASHMPSCSTSLLSNQLAEQLLVVVRVGDPREHVAVAAERHAEATQRLASQIAPRLRQVDMCEPQRCETRRGERGTTSALISALSGAMSHSVYCRITEPRLAPAHTTSL